MRSFLFLSAVLLLLTETCYAQTQWTKNDSLRLKQLLESDQELHLNQEAVKAIDFGTAVGTPRMSEEKRWMLPDESLPEVLPQPKVVLSLKPYKTDTRYNWDPIFRKKIKVDKHTWRGDAFYELCRQTLRSGRLKNRISVSGGGMYIEGGTLGGVDLMAVFTKRFWDRKGNKCRSQTLEALKAYGDSTTVLIPLPLQQPPR